MGVINERNNDFSVLIELMNLGQQLFLAFEVAAIGFALEGGTEDSQDVRIGMEGSGNRSDHEPFGIMIKQGGFNDRFASSGLSQQEAKATLLAVDTEGVEDFLLMGQEGDFTKVERVFG